MTDNTDPDCPLCNPALQAELDLAERRAAYANKRADDNAALNEAKIAWIGQLQAENTRLREALSVTTRWGELREAETVELRGVLAFYADRSSYVPGPPHLRTSLSAIDKDDGKRAREALVSTEREASDG